MIHQEHTTMTESLARTDEHLRNVTKSGSFGWNAKRERAALLLAEDKLSDDRIAEELEVSRQTLATWKKHPEFAARVDANVDEIIKRIRRHGFARLDRRLERYTKRLTQIDDIFTERGEEMGRTEEVAGGRHGLLVRIPKSITIEYAKDPDDPNSTAHEVRSERYEYRESTQMIKEERELLKQFSIEVGQFAEKREISGEIGSVVIREIHVPRPEGYES